MISDLVQGLVKMPAHPIAKIAANWIMKDPAISLEAEALVFRSSGLLGRTIRLKPIETHKVGVLGFEVTGFDLALRALQVGVPGLSVDFGWPWQPAQVEFSLQELLTVASQKTDTFPAWLKALQFGMLNLRCDEVAGVLILDAHAMLSTLPDLKMLLSPRKTKPPKGQEQPKEQEKSMPQNNPIAELVQSQLAGGLPGLRGSSVSVRLAITDALANELVEALLQQARAGGAEETPKVATPPAETPQAETPQAETPQAETPQAETPPAETGAVGGKTVLQFLRSVRVAFTEGQAEVTLEASV